eukprot:6318982-Pyramimonas_sp.AAC.1
MVVVLMGRWIALGAAWGWVAPMMKAWFCMGGYAALTAPGAVRNHSQDRNLLCAIACTAARSGSIRSVAEA